MELFVLVSRLLLAAVMGVAGVAKMADLPGARQAMLGFRIPARATPTFAVLLPVAELIAAAMLLFAPVAWLGALLALALLLAFIAGISVNLAQGRTPDCHCFGQLHSAPIGWPTLARNGVLAAVALWLVWQGPTRLAASGVNSLAGTLPLTWLALVVSVVALLIAALEGWFLLNLLQQNGRLLLRIETLEAKQGITPAVPASATPAGLPVGSVAPAFSLTALDGETYTLAALRANKKPLLLLFLDAKCGPCKALLPEIALWQRNYAALLTVVPIMRGKFDARKASEFGLQRLLLQKEKEVSEAYQVSGTPSALLVLPNGTIATPVAGGAEAIRALLPSASQMEQASQLATTTVEGGIRAASTHGDCNCGKNGFKGNGDIAMSTTNPRRGDRAPAFQLPDLSGKVIDDVSLMGDPTLIFFWNPGCGYCRQMLDDLKTWEANPPAGAPRVLFISTGTVEANQAMHLQSTIVLDSDFDVARSFGARGTPSAVLVDADGRIASDVAAGRDAVLALMSRQQLAAEKTSG